MAIKTVIITGASRGIGLAMVNKFITENYNVAILDKSTLSKETYMKLPLQRQNQVLSLAVDLLNEEEMRSGISQAFEMYGSIDILINNAATFCFANTLEVTHEQLHNLFATNFQATFLMSKLCIPFLVKSNNSHIVNIAPPLHMDPAWFKNHVAFTASKYAMSMCTLGMSAEFQSQGIAINSLWPATTIATSTIETHFESPVYQGSRLPTIMADAAFVLVEKPASALTGQFLIDETLLRENGIKDFSHYAINADMPLVQDLFITGNATDVPNGMIALSLEQYK